MEPISTPDTPLDSFAFSPAASACSPYSLRLHPVLHRGNENLTRRQKIVREVFDTEHNYISQINTIVTLFLKPIRISSIIPIDVCNVIFSNIEGILSVNQELFNYMRQRSLGEAFAYLSPFLKLYSSYANNFQEAGDTLQKWTKQNNEFHLFVKAQEARPECCHLTLGALLLAPVQRIPRYRLLLEKLLKHTKESHPDYARLNVATAQLEAIGSHINEYIRQHENFHKMFSIQNSLTGDSVPTILIPGRHFIKEGRLMKVCRRRPKERIVYLFSDIMIYGRPNMLGPVESYEYRGTLRLAHSSVEVEHNSTMVPGVNLLFRVSDHGGVSLLFYCHKEHDAHKWVEAIQEALKPYQSTKVTQVCTKVTQPISVQQKAAQDNIRPTVGNQCTHKVVPRPKSCSEVARKLQALPLTVPRPYSAGELGCHPLGNDLSPYLCLNAESSKNEEMAPLLQTRDLTQGPIPVPIAVQSACCSIM